MPTLGTDRRGKWLHSREFQINADNFPSRRHGEEVILHFRKSACITTALKRPDKSKQCYCLQFTCISVSIPIQINLGAYWLILFSSFCDVPSTYRQLPESKSSYVTLLR